MGRPNCVPTSTARKTVEVLVFAGWTQHRIAMAIGISPKTLRRHCRDELDYGWARCYVELVAAIRRRAVRGSPSALRLLRRVGLELES
jgi:hypothetical protein